MAPEKNSRDASLVEAANNAPDTAQTSQTSSAAQASRIFDTLLSSIVDLVYIFDRNGRFLYANKRLLDLLGITLGEILGKNFHDLPYPFELAERLQQQIAQVICTRQIVRDETPFLSPAGIDGVYEYIFTPVLDSRGEVDVVAGSTRDITERKQAEERERSRLTDLFMQAPAFMAALRGPHHIFEMANPPYYQLVGHRDIIGRPVAEALPEVVEQGFITLLDQVYQTGQAFVGTDVSIQLQTTPDGPLEERFVDFTYQPLRDADGFVTGILAFGIDLTERKRLEAERETLFQETERRAEREALLNQIGQAIRATDDPEEVQTRAVSLLGKALGLDLCHAAAFDPARDAWHVAPDWHRPDLPSLAGDYPMSVWRSLSDEVVLRDGTAVFTDVLAASPALSDDTRALFARMNARAYLIVPSYDAAGIPVAGLAAAMADGPREWTSEEISLIESVATLVRSASESARVQRRERNIAQSLQDALIPPPARSLPGMNLASFYRPALQEAGVGGDFFDVFPIEKGCTALVVGDLSGKGLAAASEVATVRNMVRYALYSGHTIAEAMTNLNRILVEHDLLTGFATLFVGLYDQNQHTLNYVNCGQEPGLLWQAETGEIRELSPTGPVLGGFDGGRFEQAAVSLVPGDFLSVFTDGMTEVGATRKELLEVEGVSRLLRECASNATIRRDPQVMVDCLIAGVDAFGQGGTRDDIALLVGIVGVVGDSDEKRGESRV